MKQGIIIAIDGPAGSGKSTIAKKVALHFGYIYIDTGAMYRAITFKALSQGVLLSDKQALTILAQNTILRFRYETENSDSKMELWMDNTDVTDPIRSLEVTQNVSEVAAVPGVRTALVQIQQQMGKEGAVVMDGRDIGTVVFPDADLKIFLSASVEERTRRRWLELQEKGTEIDFEDLRRQIIARDHYDSNRETDPLRQAADAYFLDTTALAIDEVTAKVIELATERGAGI